jgi:phosphoribosylamine--glycine ligase
LKLLLIGGGGREHALAWKLSQSPLAEHIYIAPGNAGTEAEPKCSNIPIPVNQIDTIINFIHSYGIELVIVGPEEPLVLGIKDACEKINIKCFGPCKEASQLEGSKSFAKDFMKKYNIPTAGYQTFSDYASASNYIKNMHYPLVIKVDGLAAGKGVIISDNAVDAEKVISQIFKEQRFGHAGNKVVIEEFLEGEELSFIAIVNDQQILPLASSQDHKRRDDHDQGPNTGGMGAYSPAPLLDENLNDYVIKNVMEKTAKGLKQENIPYHGFLYAGLMIGKDKKPKVLEFNCRLGDPETQPIMMRMKSDLLKTILSTFDKNIMPQTIEWTDESAVGVVMASKNYPDDYLKGQLILGLKGIDNDTTKVFHAGTKAYNKEVMTDGGRVLCVTSLGPTLKSAQQLAYETVKSIKWGNSFYRKDIGVRGLEKD